MQIAPPLSFMQRLWNTLLLPFNSYKNRCLVRNFRFNRLFVAKIVAGIFQGNTRYSDALGKIEEAVGSYTASIQAVEVAVGKRILEQVTLINENMHDFSRSVETSLQKVGRPLERLAGTGHILNAVTFRESQLHPQLGARW
jgi:hypothetical protein